MIIKEEITTDKLIECSGICCDSIAIDRTGWYYSIEDCTFSCPKCADYLIKIIERKDRLIDGE